MMRIYEQLFVLVKQVLIYFIIISFQLFFFCVFVFFSNPKKHETVNNCFFFTGFFFPNKKTQHREGCLVGGEKLCGHHG